MDPIARSSCFLSFSTAPFERRASTKEIRQEKHTLKKGAKEGKIEFFQHIFLYDYALLSYHSHYHLRIERLLHQYWYAWGPSMWEGKTLSHGGSEY